MANLLSLELSADALNVALARGEATVAGMKHCVRENGDIDMVSLVQSLTRKEQIALIALTARCVARTSDPVPLSELIGPY